MTRPTCESCLFYSGGIAGTCHRRAPVVRPVGFPIVSSGDWCAEHSEWADYEEAVVNEALKVAANLESQDG